MDRLTKVERIGLIAIGAITAIVLLAISIIANREAKPLDKAEQQKMEAFEKQVKAFNADTLPTTYKKKSTTRKKDKKEKATRKQPAARQANKAMERYEKDGKR